LNRQPVTDGASTAVKGGRKLPFLFSVDMTEEMKPPTKHPFSFTQQPTAPANSSSVGSLSTAIPAVEPAQPKSLSDAATLPPSSRMHSSISELSAEDLEQFRAEKFVFGKIPRVLPPKDLC
jgi:hypothetical protein